MMASGAQMQPTGYMYRMADSGRCGFSSSGGMATSTRGYERRCHAFEVGVGVAQEDRVATVSSTAESRWYTSKAHLWLHSFKRMDVREGENSGDDVSLVSDTQDQR